ncbi:lysine--tRNA ligase [Mobilicoccus pelagius]|uniref:Lysine--tRNA ligase n=1 Tax=Mobilicoccus pelagius NBRC 104925 TaxID=1089455 RepID=H5UUH0_9MICO|nr:lysine--tRNA ligase [Mobilicoccus pelagius]GAB49378.1 lysyl-tRNA synthetase [Mobilicoccus pelagius NBRC 104925]
MNDTTGPADPTPQPARRARRGRGKEKPQPEVDWVARMADEVIEAAHGRDPERTIVCASGLSPSGPIHLGNLREVMTPHLVADEIARRGVPVEHVISWDDYDRFRKVPFGVEGVDESWNAHIGKPLTSVPAPRGSEYPNWAEHFKAAMAESLERMGVRFRGISQTQQYTSGAYREQVLHAMSKRDEIDAVLAQYRTKQTEPDAAQAAAAAEGSEGAHDAEAIQAAAEGSGAASEEDGGGASGYFPYRPYSKAFGTDATRVLSYDDDTTELVYVAVGPNGEEVTESMHLDRDFHGKLVWKVDWPMRWAYEGVDFEPSGVDHSSPGSSFQVGGQIVGPIFSGHQPIGPMYAFVGIAGMAKMSSSKGGVPTPADAMRIMEPPVLRWLYTRRRPNQSFSVAFDAEIQRLYDEWDALGRKVQTPAAQPGDHAMYARAIGTAHGELQRTPVKVPYRALASVVDITGGEEAQTLRIVQGMVGDDVELTSLDQLRPRLDCARTWVLTQMPAEDRTQVRTEPDTELLASLEPQQREALEMLSARLTDDWSLEGLTTLVYGIPKMQAGFDVGEKKLPPEVKAAQRGLFALLYRLLVGSDTGPRIPTLLLCLGAERVRSLITPA